MIPGKDIDMTDNSSNIRYYVYLGLSLAVIFTGSLTNILNYDIWWHLAGGKYNLINGTILDMDVFSYTFKGYEWLNFEWLFELFFYLFYLCLRIMRTPLAFNYFFDFARTG